MKKTFHESDFQTMLGQYIKSRKGIVPTHIGEGKISKGKTIRFGAFQPQQLPSLEEAEKEGLYFKLSDASLGCKPADYIFIRGGYVALMFETTNQQDIAWWVNIKDILDLQSSGAKSISKDFAEQHGIKINLKDV